ncbi:MAG: DUF5676 family membrane protein [Caulobacter sp.]|nr:DUF5676 family membrane protein [Caulobacter sp.]
MLNPVKLGLAATIVVAVSWTICSALVVVAPGPMMQMSGQMMHANLQGIAWTMHWSGFLIGMIAWSAIAGLVVWAVAMIYNRLAGQP